MAKRKRTSTPSCSRARKKVDRDAREVESTQRLDKLPQEVWDKIFDDLESDDLFPLALSCRYFRARDREDSSCFEDESPAKAERGPANVS